VAITELLDEENILEMIDIHKNFPGVNALKGVQLKIRRGEIHALIGENGAGKSTIMKCLMGIYPTTSGKVIFDGLERKGYTTADALKFGIAMIHQELAPVLYRSVMENLWLGKQPKNKLGLIDYKTMAENTKQYLDMVDLPIEPRTLMSELTIAKMQLVEIARAISYNAKLLIMDEPTSALTNKEVDHLFDIMRKLKAEGKSIIYISHKLDEVFEVADRVSVFRDGMYIDTKKTTDVTQHSLINMMVGREITDLFPKTEKISGDILLEVRNLSCGKYFQDVSFKVSRNEIFGIAGLIGSGRTELLETIFGIRGKTSGEIFLNGRPMNSISSSEAISHKMAFLTEDRRFNGIFPMLDIKFNTSVANIKHYKSKLGFINNKKRKNDCEQNIKTFDIKTPSTSQQMQFLSGGNQQKALVARWLSIEPDIIFLDEPTRGIDVGAKSEIHRIINQLAHEGKCIVMVSSELPEILGMSDRIMIMYEGRQQVIIENKKESTQVLLMQYATGMKADGKIN